MVALVGAGAGFVMTRFMPPQYVVETTIWMERPDRGEGDRGPVRPGALLTSYAWVDLLNSYAVLDHVAEEMRLYAWTDDPDDWEVIQDLTVADDIEVGGYVLEVNGDGARYTLADEEGEVVEEGEVGTPIGSALGFAWNPAPELLTAGRSVALNVTTPRDAARGLAASLTARMMDQAGNFMRLELRGDDPERITATLNALTERFVEVAGELKRARLDEWEEILNTQLEYAATSLAQAEEALERHEVATITLPSRSTPGGGAAEDTGADPIFQDFFATNIELEDVRRDREVIQRALNQASEGSLPVEALEIVPSVQGSSEMMQALGTLNDRRAELRALRFRYTDQHPAVEEALAEVRIMEQQAVPSIARGLVAELQAREANLERRAGSARTSLQQIPVRDVEAMRLRRAVDQADAVYRDLSQRVEDARLGTSASSIADLRLLDRAQVPRTPESDQRARILFLSIIGGLGLGLLGAILMDRSDQRLRYPEQVTYELGLTILGAVPHVRHRNGGRTGDDDERVMEALRGIRFNLVHAYGSAGPLLVTVTSPGVGDGKSFITVNLALAFAELGHRTLLVDGDVRRGGIHSLVEGRRKPGLTDYLAGKETREGIIQETLFPSLHLIGSGTRMSHGPELLASAAMRQLIAELRASYSVILVDSPPLGAAVDPLILGALTGNFLFVVRNGTTDRSFAEAKLEMVDRLPIRILGAVLNDVPSSTVYQGYSYLPGYLAVDEDEGGTKERPAKLLSSL
ncbi:MAG: polysaccharide biosynthesis tyrosine autokinase [Gemmatimonadota bacterium]